VAPILKAWWATGAFGVADLIFVVDQDDARAEEYEKEIAKENAAQVFWRKDWEPLVPKLNRAALLAARDYPIVAFMGDDHLPRTPMWAHQLHKAGTLQRPSITTGADGYHDQKLPTWWSMSSDVIQTLGMMVPAPVQHLFCDNAVKLLGELTQALIYLPDVLIEHMHPVAGKAPSDDQYKRVNRQSQFESDQASLHQWARTTLDAQVEAIRALR
jgi:hypothetical protein